MSSKEGNGVRPLIVRLAQSDGRRRVLLTLVGGPLGESTVRLKLHHQILIAMLLGAGIGLPLNILAQKTLRFTLPPDTRDRLTEGRIDT